MPCFPRFLVFHSSLKQPRSQSLALFSLLSPLSFSLSLSCFVSIPSIFAALRLPRVYPALVIVSLAVPCRAWQRRIWFFPNRLSPTILTSYRSFTGILPNRLVVYTISWPSTRLLLRNKKEKKGGRQRHFVFLSLTLSHSHFFFAATKSYSLASLDGNGSSQAGRDPSEIRRG